MPLTRVVGLSIVFQWFFIGGIAHFVATKTAMRGSCSCVFQRIINSTGLKFLAMKCGDS
jgi:hypothetical protein